MLKLASGGMRLEIGTESSLPLYLLCVDLDEKLKNRVTGLRPSSRSRYNHLRPFRWLFQRIRHFPYVISAQPNNF